MMLTENTQREGIRPSQPPPPISSTPLLPSLLTIYDNPPSILDHQLNTSSSPNASTSSLSPITDQKIEIINQDMTKLMRKLRYDNTVAFAHCISGDFGCDRHMTAGVAVKFKKEFGKPVIWNCVGNHLTYQRTENGAGVYGMVTKLVYDDKPTIDDYNEAFCQLTKNFQEQNFKLLICSPLGCVRDKIPVEHFVSKIVQFNHDTGASVRIVAYQQPSAQRILNNGLSHDVFIDTIQNLISSELSKLHQKTTSSLETPLNLMSETSPGSSRPESQPSSQVNTSSEPATSFHLQFSTPKNFPENSESEYQKQSSGLSVSDNVISFDGQIIAGNDRSFPNPHPPPP